MIIENLRTRWIVIALVFIVTVIWTVPNFIKPESPLLKYWPTKSRMIYGLDIQGGSHLVLKVDVDSAVKLDAVRMAAQLPNQLKEEKVEVKGAEVVDPLHGGIKITLNEPGDASKVTDVLNKFYGNTLKITNTSGTDINVEYGELHLREFKSNLLNQAISVIRNRIDEFGVAEPSITAQGTDRILVQLPGIKDASTAKDLINRTARLDFMMVDKEAGKIDLQKLITEAETAAGISLKTKDNDKGLKYSEYVEKLNEALKGKIPPNTVVYFEKPDNAETMDVGRIPFLLSTTETVTGGRLTNAQVGADQFGKPIVQFNFDAVGTREFGDMTRKHVNEPMAIVLDKIVKSAPNINEPITQGRGQITLGGGRDPQKSMTEAKLISTALRAGALPATLEQLEERTVGPSLGADAIRQGQIGTLIAALAVFVFMALYYKTFGIVADLALAFNLMITIAILSSLGATLTLPGVAGLALTLGIAVDASVIIFERVKEEMHKGATLPAAIREGYQRAFSSIFDANVTSIAVCVVLYYFGTGPIRGFAVTLLTGLVITTFTGVFFTRAILDTLVNKWKWNLSVR